MSGVQRESGAVYPTSPRSPGQMRHRKRSHEVSNETNEPNGSHLLVNDQNKYASMKTRAWSTLWMLGVFCAIIYLGHVHIVVTVVIIQVFMVKEIFALARRAHEERDLPGFRILNWHFFVAAMIYVYGLILREQLLNTVFSDKYVNWLTSNFIKYHLLICYSLYITGFVWFILTLKKGMYKYQFSQFAWTHMILLVVLAQSSFTVANIFEGLFWFILPASLIIINDVAAYLWGFFFGRRPLIQLSPKKTWEGFIGASLTTILCAFMVASFLGRYQWLACPRKDLSIGWLYCDPDPLFKPKIYYLNMFSSSFPWKQITALPVQWHALWFGLFASSIAPFGGFFASGFKRAFKIKDFGDSIPGHGGITDRMDCQMGMAVFTYIYYNTFIKPNRNTVETILRQILENLTIDDQMNLYKQLGLILTGWQNVTASSVPL